MQRTAKQHSLVNAAIVYTTVLIAWAAAPAMANVAWQWSFETEAGTFVTDGDMVGGLAPAGSYTVDVDTFVVTSSFIPSLVGTDYYENQPLQGFLWDGVAPTEFWRSSGFYHNGMNFFHSVSGYWYGFYPNPTSLYDEEEYTVLEGPLTLEPLSSVPTIPVPASLGLVVAGLLSLGRLKRRP